MNIKPKYLVIPVLLVLMLSQPVSAVACPAEGCYINGTIYRWDTDSALSGVTVANASNASQTATTGASGNFNISWYDYSNSSASGGHNLTVTTPSGYTTGNVLIKIEIAGNDVSNSTAGIIRVRPITPTISAISAASITKTGATISWTSNNSAVGNRIKYSPDTALATNYFYSDWSNSTASPSFAVSGLPVNTKEYYQVETYNTVNNSYSATSSILNFTTLSGTYIKDKPEAYIVPQSLVQTPAPAKKDGLGLGAITGGKSGKVSKSFVGFVLIVLIGAVVYFLHANQKTPKVKKSKRK